MREIITKSTTFVRERQEVWAERQGLEEAAPNRLNFKGIRAEPYRVRPGM